MSVLLDYLGRIFRRAFAGAQGQARAVPFYLTLATGAAWLAGWNVLLKVPTAAITAFWFMCTLVLALGWAPYKVFLEEKSRADSAEGRLDNAAALQAQADMLAQFVDAGTTLLEDEKEIMGMSRGWLIAVQAWHENLYAWTNANLPQAEHLQIKSSARLYPIETAAQSLFYQERYVVPMMQRVAKLRLVTSRYQEMAYNAKKINIHAGS